MESLCTGGRAQGMSHTGTAGDVKIKYVCTKCTLCLTSRRVTSINALVLACVSERKLALPSQKYEFGVLWVVGVVLYIGFAHFAHNCIIHFVNGNPVSL